MRFNPVLRKCAPALWCLCAAAGAAPAPTGHVGLPNVVQGQVSPTDGMASVQPGQASYRVDESIRFFVESRQSAYVYVLAIDSATGHAHLLEPAFERAALRVIPGMSFDFPPDGIDFYADKPGVERVVFVASQREINLDE